MKFIQLISATTLAFASMAAQATVIGFEEFGNVGVTGTVVTNQYPEVTFSSSGGNVNIVSSQPNIGFGLNFLCTASGSINCTGETVLDFTSKVSNLSLWAVGSNDAGVTAKVDVFTNGAYTATQDITTNGIFNTPNFVDLTAYHNVTSIRLYGITDGGGLGWDNFEFTSAVPEADSYAMLLAGLGVVGLMARRRKSV